MFFHIYSIFYRNDVKTSYVVYSQQLNKSHSTHAHSTMAFQPPLLETRLSAISLGDHDYVAHVRHTSGLYRRRVQCWRGRLQWVENTKYVNLSTRSMSIDGGAGCSDFPRIRRGRKTISRDFEQFNCKLFLAARVLTFAIHHHVYGTNGSMHQ